MSTQKITNNYAHLNFFELGFLAILIFIAFSVLPSRVFAATLSVDPSSGEFGPGDTFMVTVRLDTNVDECINSASAELHYPADLIKASAVSNGESLFTLWTEEPSVDLEQGIVRFEGGIPGGYCGLIQGDPERTNIVAKVIFSVPGNMIGGRAVGDREPMTVTFGSSTRVLLNDGFGSVAALSLKSGKYVRTRTSLGLKNEWLNVTQQDVTSPELFNVSLERDANTFQGKYFIVFSTVDKQSGVHHYEVMEDDPLRLGFVRGKKNEKALFMTVKSPYVISDQTLGSRITVRAFDHAGNVQETILPPGGITAAPQTSSSENDGTYRVWWYFGGTLVLLVLGVFVWVFYRSSKEGDV